MDNRFGKDTYTIKQDESYYRWFVTLNQYPDLTVYYTVSRDPLSMTSPSITTNFDEVFSEHAVEEYKKRMNLVMMFLFLMIPLILYITQKLNPLKN